MKTDPRYTENPKTAGSGIVCCIPQTGNCPVGCADCFFQSGNSYLEPLAENLPNIPSLRQVGHKVVRVNDGNDSNVDRAEVIAQTSHFPLKFYNTSIPTDLEGFPGPVVLTVNPGQMTDRRFHDLRPIPRNLMFVRFRANTWNVALAELVVDHYARQHGVPVVMTFMAYHSVESIPENRLDRSCYAERVRTLNSYWAITTDAWRKVMGEFQDDPLVYSCGVIEGEKGTTKCKHCGNCLREFFSTMERLEGA